MNQNTLVSASVLIAILLWSSAASLITALNDIPPIELLALSHLFGFFYVGFYRFYKNKSLKPFFSASIKNYLIGLLGVSFAILLYYIGMRNAPPLEANLLNYLWPILIVLISALVNKKRLSKKITLSVSMGFIGAFLLISKDSGLSFDIQSGHIMAFTGAVLWAYFCVISKKINLNQDHMVLIFALSSIILLIASALFEDMAMPSTLVDYILLILLGTLATAYIFWNYAMKHGDADVIAVYAYIIPFFSNILLIAFGLAETSPRIYLAMTFIFGGIIVISFDKIKLLIPRTHRL